MAAWKMYRKQFVDTLQHRLRLYEVEVQNAIDFIHSIENEAKLDERGDGANTTPLLKSLINLKERIINISKKDEERNWINNGLAELTDILRADSDSLDELAYSIIRYLVKYLKANQGCIYFLNDDELEYEQYLDLKGCYAYNKRKFLVNRIGAEEGLLGQCFQEGEHIYLTEVPSTYVKITSGLGEATPTCIILVPLISNGKKAGVFELAFFKTLHKYQIEFLLKVAEIIASIVISAKDNEHTNLLLNQSESLTTKLKINEEEMRQNLEEMTALQEEMMRQNKELEHVREELIAKQHEMLLKQKQNDELLEFKLKANNDINATIIQKLKQRIKMMEAKALPDNAYINN